MALTMVCLLTANAVAPLSFNRGALWHTALPGSALTFVHVILLPALVWPGHDLTTRDLARTFAQALAMLPVTLLGIVAGLVAGIASATLLIAPAFLMPSLFLGSPAAGCFAGGAICCGLAAWIANASRREPKQIAVRVRTAVLGGGAAALVLFVFVMLPELREVPYVETVTEPGLLRLSLLLALAGLPHLLLTCRDLGHQPPTLAALPIAACRCGVVLALLGGGALLLAAARD